MSVQTIFITGASSGFGAACARMFAKPGNRIVLTARRVDPLLALQEELAGKADIHIIPLDVRDREAVQGAVESLPERFREIDVLLNNAGLALGLEPAHEVNLDDWEAMVADVLYPLDPARHGGPQSRPHRQHQLNGRRLALSGRQCLRRQQGLRDPIFP